MIIESDATDLENKKVNLLVDKSITEDIKSGKLHPYTADDILRIAEEADHLHAQGKLASATKSFIDLCKKYELQY